MVKAGPPEDHYSELQGIMNSKERWKYHDTHRIYHRPRNWTRCFREGWLEEDRRGLRRQRSAFQVVRVCLSANTCEVAQVPVPHQEPGVGP